MNKLLKYSVNYIFPIIISFVFCLATYSEINGLQTSKTTKEFNDNTVIEEKSKLNINDDSYFPDIEKYDEMINRPLFNQDRRPYVHKPSKKKNDKKKNISEPKQYNQYRLSAVVITPSDKVAILQSKKDKKTHRIRLGDKIDSWALIEVNPYSVKIDNGKTIKELELEIKKSEKQNKPKAKSNPTTTTQTKKSDKKEINNGNNNFPVERTNPLHHQTRKTSTIDKKVPSQP